MKKAVAYIDKAAIIELLKMPYHINLIGMEYPSKDDMIKITLEGDPLPTDKINPKAKRYPEVGYQILRHWHNAKIFKKDEKNEIKD